MADINFDCPHCGHNLDVNERGAGLTVACPECSKNIEIPVPELRVSDIVFNCGSCRQPLKAPPDMAGQLIDCPACKKPTEIPFPSGPTPSSPTRPAAKSTPIPKPPGPRQVPATGTSGPSAWGTEEGRMCTGTKYTLEEAKQLLVGQDIKNYLSSARTAVEREDWIESDRFYNLVQQNQPDNLESIYFGAYGRARQSLSEYNIAKRKQCFNVLRNSLVYEPLPKNWTGC